MTRELLLSRSRSELLWSILFATLVVIAFAASATDAATVQEDRSTSAVPERVGGDGRSDRVIVEPDRPWNGWGDWNPGWHDGGPRVDVWVDRGDWSVYQPGDVLGVYFRVDRPCYVTIVDYAPDGSVEMLFPNRWSGSNFVYPDRTYRIPESRNYSLRIAGSGGEETLYACAHSAPWPSVSGGGYWLPPYPSNGGRVVVGRPGRGFPPGRRGRVVVGPDRFWPVPDAWRGRTDRWACDSVTFYVDSAYPWSSHGSGWRDDYVNPPDAPAPWYGGQQGLIFRDAFRMADCSDSYYRNIDGRRSPLVVNVECTESRRGHPTEIVGRIVWEDGWGSETLFRMDVEGKHGERPVGDRVYSAYTGDVAVEIRVEDFRLSTTKPWQLPSIDWIEFEVRVVDE